MDINLKLAGTHGALAPEQLRWRCVPEQLGFETTAEVAPSAETIGQHRALDAIRVGLNVDSTGYNIFITGLAGTGRTSTIKRILEEITKDKTEVPDDLCYVNNFKNPDTPRVLTLPAGKGRHLKRRMSELIEALRKDIPAVFESEDYQRRSREALEAYLERKKALLGQFERKVNQERFVLIQVHVGPFLKPDLAPIINDQPIDMDQAAKLVDAGQLSAEDYHRLREKYVELTDEMETVLKESRKIDQEIAEEQRKLEKEIILPLVNDYIADIRRSFPYPKVDIYLDEVSLHITENLQRFRRPAEARPMIPGLPVPQDQEQFTEFEVNVLVDNSDTRGAPIIVETNPNYRNLFGTVERVVDRFGVWRTDFTRIKAGSFLQANGGYLILNAMDVLIEPGSWVALKRALKTRIVEIQSYDPFFLISTSALKPEPIEYRVKVVLIGNSFLYHLLFSFDEEFQKIFKVRADFDVVMDKTDENLRRYASFVRKICQDEDLLPFDKTAVATVLEEGVRLAGRQSKVSTRFDRMADLLREAHYWAKRDASDIILARHVHEAIERRVDRMSLVREKIQEMIKEGTLMIDTVGTVVGQVNGLSVHDMGDFAFGRPSRITAQTSMGRAGIINIEREADLSGKTHNKGVLILGGYLRGKYAQNKPLTVSASLCFEQSYSGIDGDSASSTEIYAILSSLAKLPLRQDIAVTGSVNQLGEVQPIGGVNEKIEGFFDVCEAKGLTGKQGVIIPRRNVEDLMLRMDVVEAVREGKFHIYPVDTIDQGIEILTGVKAGERREDGAFEEGTVNYLVDQELTNLAKRMREFGAEQGDEEGDSK